MTIEEYFGDWTKVIDIEEVLKVLDKLKRINPSLLCPSVRNIFKAFELCQYKDCKVIFVGQDPYPQKGVATGILFGNNTTEDSILSPSLQVIKEAVINYEVPHYNVKFDNSLESWARQGILMINSALTVEMNKIGSHTMLWRPFISKLLTNLSNRENGLIYVLFGKQAQTFKPYINSTFNTILEEKHPAYYSRTNKSMSNTIFKQIDKLLNDKYGEKIIWYEEE